jgi:hypothetical protein
MKNKYYSALCLALVILISSCQNNKASKESKKDETKTNIDSITKAKNELVSNIPYYWIGTINKTIPVFLNFTFVDSLFIGEITYLNTKKREPLLILGSIENDSSYRLEEFEASGNISGVLIINHTANLLRGYWYSTKKDFEFELSMSKKDTALPSKNFKVDRSEVSGIYAYSYGEKGYQGNFEINKITDTSAEISAFSVTREPSRNIAEIEKDTVTIKNNSFIYKNPSSDSCMYKISLYKDFLYVKYLNGPGDCFSQYGVNADIIGIYLKTPKSIIDLTE